MLVSNWIIFGTAELMALLLALCVFLLFHARKLKNLTQLLQNKLQQLVQDLKKSKQTCSELERTLSQTTTAPYSEMVEQQLEKTREYHLSLKPDQDIRLDLNSDTPQSRQIASLRHAFLISEKEATLASPDEGNPNWDLLQARLGNLMNFFRSENKGKTDQPEQATKEGVEELEELKKALANSQQRIENLEKFKTLFFELEEKWDLAQQQAQICHEELSGFDVGSQQQENFEDLLQRYQNAYNEFGNQLQVNSKSSGITQIVEVPSSHKPSDELQHLKSVTANQHHLITELQQRLAIAYSAADKEELIEDLKSQLDKQLRYVKESETCIELMDNELSKANKQIEQMQSRIEKLEYNSEKSAQVIHKARILKEERAMMNRNIQNLEQENEQLVTQLEALMQGNSKGGGDGENNPALQKQLQQLQEQYTTLENKYLALRMKS